MSPRLAAAEAFARSAHAGQTRKGAAAEPYIEHVAEVARFTAMWGGDEDAVVAAWLHDTVEDCGASLDDIARRFGAAVAALVRELTDDKSLPKAERKRLQVAHAPAKSAAAALIKVADKTSNVGALALSSPADWPRERLIAYVDWAEAVVAALPDSPPVALATFGDAAARARNSFA